MKNLRIKRLIAAISTLAVTIIVIGQFSVADLSSVPTTVSPVPLATPTPKKITLPIRGYVDMHTHPMAHLGFGKKLLHGAPDIGSIVPKGGYACNPEEFRATKMYEALSSCAGTHGGWGTDNKCGDTLRAAMINFGVDDGFKYRVPPEQNLHGDHHHPGFPDFKYWPHQTSKLHQQMWYEWIKRAKDGGLRVMVALSVNSQLLANAINGDSPKNDVGSSNLQITEIKSFVKRHNDFMEIAYTPADLRRIVTADKLAVILGMEIDDFGGYLAQGKAFSMFPEATQRLLVRAELQRVYDQGVRYLFPIHLTNNVFGGTAVYNVLFNFANKHNSGSYFDVQHSPVDSIKYNINFNGNETNILTVHLRQLMDEVGELPAPCFNNISCLPGGKVRCCSPALDILKDAWGMDGNAPAYAGILPGHINRLGLTPLGEFAIGEMMKMGMMIDIDHMGVKSMSGALDIAENFKGGYPVNMGHNGIRYNDSKHVGTERNVSGEQVMRVIKLNGMFGVGSSDMTPAEFIAAYRRVMNWVENHGGPYASLGIGTDANGLEPLPKQTPGLISTMFYEKTGLTRLQLKDSTGAVVRTWDYTQEGVAHYGLMNEFMRDVKMQPNGQDVYDHLWQSAEHFAKMWEKCESLAEKK
jgi:microsomal dipeptidase-like Zn-dependent dipeptidase